ncbi:MAG: DUF2156 domain-containing protein [Corynebacterium sp.]|nr:DUF2156 domain-containing protein [Corynebacterium sp.]
MFLKSAESSSRWKDLTRQAFRRMGRTWSSIADIYAQAPATMSAITLMWFLLITFRNDLNALRFYFAINLDNPGNWWHVVSSGFTANSVAAGVITTVALLTFGVLSERALGTKRFMGLMVFFQLIGTLAGLIAVWILGHFSTLWVLELRHQRLLSPTTWLFGVAAVGTAVMPVLWQRRVRVFLLATSITLFLYSGGIGDVPRLVATLLGLILGQVFFLRNSRRGAISRRESRVLVATVLFAVTIGPFVGSLTHAVGPFSKLVQYVWTPRDLEQMQVFLCMEDQVHLFCSNRLYEELSDFALLISNQLFPLCMAVIVLGLIRGRRLAWVLALIVSFAPILIILTLARDFSLLGICAVLAPWIGTIILLSARSSLFDVPLPRRLLLGVATRISLLFVVSSALWAALGIPANLSATQWISSFMPPVLGASLSDSHLPHTHLAMAAYIWPSLIFWLGFCLIMVRAFTIVPRSAATEARSKARETLLNGTGDHLAWMTLWEGNSYWFDPEGRGYVAYHVHNGVAVTVGAPVINIQSSSFDPGVLSAEQIATHDFLTAEERERLPLQAQEKKNEALRARALDELHAATAAAYGNSLSALSQGFEEFAGKQGWHVAWYSVNSDFAQGLEQRGWRSVQVAEESVIPVVTEEDIAFKGKKFQDVRTAKNRASKEGIHTEWTSWAEASSITRERIIALSEDWVADKSLPEMGFTLGGIDELMDPSVRLMLATDDSGHIHGVTSWLPVFENGRAVGLILDFMRRDAEGFKPVVEYLIAETIELAHDAGYEWISLSGAPLAHSVEDSATGDASVLSTVLDKVGAVLEPLYGFRSLAHFKAKFQPRHEPWMMCYADELALASIGMAVGKCYVPSMGPGQFVHVARQLANR